MTTMSNGTGTMTDQFTDAMARGQQAMSEAATGAAKLWSAAFQGAEGASTSVPQSGAFPIAMPSVGEMIDRSYDTGIAVLEMQRSVAHQVLDALRLR
ncbi:hypothetical protein [Actinomycetospora atypica]|uniref:Uncharacterized protein n=1 Tax=Actinomycetospora atypica TaxID=1290095 RepID=A0ABV9YL97_9PSEU